VRAGQVRISVEKGAYATIEETVPESCLDSIAIIDGCKYTEDCGCDVCFPISLCRLHTHSAPPPPAPCVSS
jgi:hypothetical protein